MQTSSPLSPDLLREAHCWFAVDRVAGDEAATAWRRRARRRQVAWREARGHDPGTSPYDGSIVRDRQPSKVGSRLPLRLAERDGLNFLTEAAREAVRHRLAHPEPHQMLAEDRLWADLLSSMPLCFNVFGEAWREPARARSVVELLAPGAPAGDVEVIFEHSPGRLDAMYLGNRTAFDMAFHVGEGVSRGIVGVETKYHEHPVREPRPEGERLRRYEEVAERSGVFVEGWRERILGTELQ